MLKHTLKVTITLSDGDKFASSGKNTIIIEGLRVVMSATQFGGMETGKAVIGIYGMLESDMNQITTLSTDQYNKEQKNFIRQHIITVEADGSQAFSGVIVNAWGMYQAQPDVYLHIEANELFVYKTQSYPSTSIQGVYQVADVFKGFADYMKLNFENNGVDIISDDLYLTGSVVDQALRLAKDQKIEIEFYAGTLVICRLGQSRSGKIPLLNGDTGLVGYPTFDTYGTSFRCLYHPGIRRLGIVRIETPIKRAAGEWRVNMIKLNLESEKPDAAWFMDCRAIAAYLPVQAA